MTSETLTAAADLQPHQREYIDRRYGQALWYALGREDAGERVDAMAFARFAEHEAHAFVTEATCYLESVAGQYRRFCALGEGGGDDDAR